MEKLSKILELAPILLSYPKWAQGLFLITLGILAISLVVFLSFLPGALQQRKLAGGTQFRITSPKDGAFLVLRRLAVSGTGARPDSDNKITAQAVHCDTGQTAHAAHQATVDSDGTWRTGSITLAKSGRYDVTVIAIIAGSKYSQTLRINADFASSKDKTAASPGQSPTTTERFPDQPTGVAIPCKRERLGATGPPFEQLKLAVTKSREDVVRVLDEHPTAAASLVGRGDLAIVFRTYSLGSDLSVDFLVISAPQWYQLDIILLGEPNKIPFKSDGSMSPELHTLINKAKRTLLRLNDSAGHVGRDLSRSILGASTRILDIVGNCEPGSFRHPETIASGFARLQYQRGGRHGGVTVVMGRRDMYGTSENEGRRIALASESGITLITYDLFLESVGPRELDPRYYRHRHRARLKLLVGTSAFSLPQSNDDADNEFKMNWWGNIQIKGDGRVVSRLYIGVDTCEIEVSQPGEYTVTFPKLHGFDPIPAARITVPHNDTGEFRVLLSPLEKRKE